MTTPTRNRRRRRRPAALAGTAPAAQARTQMPPAPARARGTGGCCRTWTSEHLSLGGTVVRTTWHEPACRIWGRP
ncbi:hypothetical protein [Kitasatospora herbaricolor]|uniref:Uncharacterized protein n=1 Tax=Kitasatospora herbaricolor TaxID=68217 RepID=A0ABZ1W0Q6_9ACTN|nr:hypothetical protein [Kitasatospora herbaricolor]